MWCNLIVFVNIMYLNRIDGKDLESERSRDSFSSQFSPFLHSTKTSPFHRPKIKNNNTNNCKYTSQDSQ